MDVTKEPLFTPRFFLMCGFTFTVFVSAFQLIPTAPFHIKDLGGSTFASGLFLAFLTMRRRRSRRSPVRWPTGSGCGARSSSEARR